MKKKIVLIAMPAFLLAAMGTFSACGGSTESNASEEHVEHVHYACPMDCEDGKTYTEAGTCPVCEMDLEEMDS